MDWCLEDEDLMKCEALELAKKKELAWEEHHGGSVTALIEEIEADLTSATREIHVVASLQVDEVRQSLGTLTGLDRDGNRLVKKFEHLGNLMSSEREDIKHFKHLKEVHNALEKITAVTSTAEMLLSLQQRFVDLQEMLKDPQQRVGGVLDELLPVYQFKTEMKEHQEGGGQASFSGHFELLAGLVKCALGNMRESFVGLAARADHINKVEVSGGDWEPLVDSVMSQLQDLLGVVLNAEVATMLADCPDHFDGEEQEALARGTTGLSPSGDDCTALWEVVLLWIARGIETLWWRFLGTDAPGTEPAVLEDTAVSKVLEKLNEWTRSIDGLIFNLIKDGHDSPTDAAFAEGVWGSKHAAQAVARQAIDTGHEMVMRVLRVYQSRMVSPNTKLSPPEALQIIKWSRVYESSTGILGVCKDLGFEELPPALQPTILTQEGKNEVSAKTGVLLRHAVQHLKEWLCDTAASQARVIDQMLFSDRNAIHEKPPMQHLGTMAPVDFFELLSTQYNEISYFKDSVALDSLLAGIQLASSFFAENLSQSCRWSHIEELRSLGKIKDDWFTSLGHRMRIGCAIANDITQCETELPEYELKFKQVLPIEKHSLLSFELANNAFHEARRIACQAVADAVFEDCAPICSELFMGTDLSHYSEMQPRLQELLATVDDYTNDLRKDLHPLRYKDVMAVLLRHIEVGYLQRFCEWLGGEGQGAGEHAPKAKPAELRSGCGDGLRTDFGGMRSSFASFDEDATPSEAIPSVAMLAEASTSGNFKNASRTLLSAFPDCPSELGPLIVSRRVDLSEKEKVSCIEAWKALVAEQQRNEYDLPLGVLPTSQGRTLLSFVSVEDAHSGNRISMFIGKFWQKKKGGAVGGGGGPAEALVCPGCGERAVRGEAFTSRTLKGHMAACSAVATKGPAEAGSPQAGVSPGGPGTPPPAAGLPGDPGVKVTALADFLVDD